MRIRSSCALLALTALSTCALPTAAAQRTDRRLLAFAADIGGNVDIYIIRADGSGLHRLTRSPARDDSPSWSPDGRSLAFRSWRGGDEDIYVINADGTGERDISRSPETVDRSPAWSPDGSAIAFAKGAEGGDAYLDDIWVMSPDGTNQRQLTHRVGIDEYPVWSPDGRSLAFACTDGRILPNRNGDFEICLMGDDGSNVRHVTDAAGTSHAYSWSPDGRLLAFASSRSDNPSSLSVGGDLFLLDVATKKVTKLTRGKAIDFQPAFSSNGRQLLFGSTRKSAVGNLFLLTLSSHHVRQLTRLRGEVGDAVWRP
jgi:TolB protein